MQWKKVQNFGGVGVVVIEGHFKKKGNSICFYYRGQNWGWGDIGHCPPPPPFSSAGSVFSKHWVLYQLSFLFQIWWLTLCPLSRAPAIFDTFVILVRAIKKREIYTEEKKPWKTEEIFSPLCQLTSFFDQWVNQPGFCFDFWRKQQENPSRLIPQLCRNWAWPII